MGRVKGTHIKRMAKQIVQRFPDQFSANFTANKQKLKAMGLKMTSKLERNKLVGEVTIMVKQILAKAKQAEATA